MLRNRVECQLRHPCTPTTAREWGHCVGRHSDKGPEQIAAETGIPLKRLMKITAPQSDAKPHPEEVAAVTRVTGRLEWFRFYARQAGLELFLLPPLVVGVDDHEILTASCEAVLQFGELMKAISDAWKDRRVEAGELARFNNEKADVMAAIERVSAFLRARAHSESKAAFA